MRVFSFLVFHLLCWKYAPRIQICTCPFGSNHRSKWNCLWWAVGQNLRSAMTLSLHLIRSCFRCSADAANAIWPAVKFQWQHVSREDDDSTEMLCSLNCCLHFPPHSCLSHSNRIPCTITVVHDCSILPFLEWSDASLNAALRIVRLELSFLFRFVFVLFFSCVCLLFSRAFVLPLYI